ncbi:MAG TPA: flagellar basal-body rod protein FlgG [Rhizomicrobium sp.]|nr:flagellar basal-body rod protein FlgG [Rhizomicrobium sp.]
MRALSIASTGMMAQQTNVEVIANNLANMSTTGYKAQRAAFQDLLYQNIQQAGAQSSDTGTLLASGIQLGAGVRTAAVYRMTKPGDMKSTSNPYDVAINGAGYFRVQMPDGTDAYTRDGNFQLSPEGQLVTQQGYVVQPGIAVPPTATAVTINTQGQVQAQLPGQVALQLVGQIEMTRFPNDAGLRAMGDDLFAETPSSGAPQAGVPGSTGYGTIQQYFLETSNVDPVSEITTMISAQRAYEMNSKVISTADQMMAEAAKLGA